MRLVHRLSLLALGALLSAPGFAQGEAPITKLPKLVRFVDATYPPLALRDRVGATVTLELEIGADGAVAEVSVVSTATTSEAPALEGAQTATIADYGFAAAATVAAFELGFEPAEADGVPVVVRVGFTYRFAPPPPPLPEAVASDQPLEDRPRVESLRGVVRERGTRRLVPGAVVTIFLGDGEAGGFEAVSDGEGVFVFYDLAPGEWRVMVEAPAYFPARTTEVVRTGEVVEATYFIERGAYSPYDVVVEARRIKKEVNRRTLTAAEIVKVPGTLGDPIQVVENLPGVARPPAFSGQLIVRGSGPQDTGVYVDGIEVPLIYHFGGLRSVLPAEVIDSVDFYPGNFPVYYGRRMGGAYDAKVKRLAPDQLHGSLDVSLLDAGLYLEMPIGETAAVAIAGRRSYIDAILNAAVPDDASVNLISAPVYYDFQIIGSWRPSDAHSLQVFVLGFDDTFKLLFENPADQSTALRSGNLQLSAGSQRGILSYRYTPGPRYRHSTTLAVGRDLAGFSLGDQLRFTLDVLAFDLRDNAEWKVSETLTLYGGVDARLQLADVEVLLPLPPAEGAAQRPFDPDNVLYARTVNQPFLAVSPFVEAAIELGDLLLIPGLRVDYYEYLKAVGVDPRLVARYRLAEDWVGKLGVGLFQQAPNAQETNEIFGNPNLGLQRAIHYSAGAEWTPEPHLKFDLTLFYKDLDRLVSRTNATGERDGRVVPLNYDNGATGRVYGLELFIRHDLSDNFRGWLSYTLSRAERTDSGQTRARLFDFDQTHILNMVFSYSFPENIEVGVRWRLVSGNPYTPILGGTFAVDADLFAPISGPINSDRLPLFHQLDLRIDKRWIFDRFTLAAYLSLVNTYNRTNTEGFSFNYDFTQRRPIQGLPVFPILGVRGDF